ncbi:glycosyltransferase family 4 protein [Iningainema tapete]|uniref:Glycosyltransferase family 4 protein n=1 Tax=Iningainema tapete BLCC-T55 TaxID=2748662 RepID=A0A8J6XS06_9CYAN|nr:glycosyltransferase family 4 protein [Iningainema tapete]MBD2777355.1 glycosyltransferase family 4 protein [Iningainema tapete BLCC-T55]
MNLLHKLKQFISRVKGYQLDWLKSYYKMVGGDRIQEYDLVFVLYDTTRGWILEAICKEIAAYFPGKYCYHYSTSKLPRSRAYFFSHYGLFPPSLQQNPFLRDAKSIIWYTHPKDIGISNQELISVLNQATKVVCTCSEFVHLLQSQGLSSHKTTFVLGGADAEIFQPHQRAQGAIGFCTAYYPRKSPEKILSIIKMMPHRKFILLGRNWREYENFVDLVSLPNISYIEVPYTDYPKYYAQMDVFVSVAKLEGGPIPLIEAMMCNVFPVASKTGFAPDIITHGNNGFLFEIDSPVEEICDLIEKAFQIETDVRATVENLTWRNFSLEIQKLI